MKIAFDNDDVITRHPKLFSVLTKALVKDENEIFIITDSDELFRHQIEKQLLIDNIRYHHLIITNKKESFCKSNGIKFMMDDSYEYFKNSDNANIFVCAIK